MKKEQIARINELARKAKTVIEPDGSRHPLLKKK